MLPILKRADRCVVISFLLGGLFLFVAIAVWSRVYWGYSLHPPVPDDQIAQITHIKAVEEYRSSPDAQTEPVLLPQRANEKKAGHFSSPEDRVLELLAQRGLAMPRSTEVAPVGRRQLVRALGLGSDFYAGRIISGSNAAGESILVLSGSSYPLDHRRYTEVVVALDPDGKLKNILSFRMFNYDAAGLEWLTPAVLYLAGAAVMCCGIVMTVYILYRRRRQGTPESHLNE